MNGWLFILFALFLRVFASAYPETGIHLPLYREETPSLRRRDGGTGEIGLGDYVDV